MTTPAWYRQHAPRHLTLARYAPGSPNQRVLGCDLVLTLPAGQPLWVEEKARRAHWPDVALEVAIARPTRQVSGWLWHTLAHVLVYSSPQEVLVADLPEVRWALYQATRRVSDPPITIPASDAAYGGVAYNVLLDRTWFPRKVCHGCGRHRWTGLAPCDTCNEVRYRFDRSDTNRWPTAEGRSPTQPV